MCDEERLMNKSTTGLFSAYEDIWLLDGLRTAFADYNGVLGLVSPIDLGIKAARSLFTRTKIAPGDVNSIIAGSVAQASFDAYMLPRHIGLYSGVPYDRPAHLVQRVCGTGIEAISQAADAIALKKIQLALCVGAESMSRNPIAAFTHRGGFRMGQVEFKDFLWEALLDTCPNVTMGGTAENLAKQYKVTRDDADRFAELSFSRAVTAQKDCFLSGEITPVVTEQFDLPNYKPRGIRLPKGTERFDSDTHIRPSSLEALAKIPPAFGGVQTGGNSSAIVDGAAAALVASGSYANSQNLEPLARIAAIATVGVPPEIMGISPANAIRALLDGVSLPLDAINRFEINEAFAAQYIAVERELELDRSKVNVNGGAIAIGHPLAATGLRLALTLARELVRSKLRWGVASACIGGGQGIALLLENQRAKAH
jgi:acetyl-CoA C-acetyltransferase